MTGLFVKPCCRAGSFHSQSLSSAKDGLYFVPVIVAKFWLLSLLMLVLFQGSLLALNSLNSLQVSKSHSAFPRSRLTPTPWPSQSQRQRQPQSKPLLRRRKTTMTLPAVARAGSMRAPRQTRPLPRSERPTISLVVAAPARGGQWQTTISPRAVRIRPLQSGLLRQKARAKKSSYPDLSTSSRGILHCFPPEWQRKKWQ